MTNFKFNDSDRKMIEEAVIESEKKTSGEIVTAFIKESYDYAIYELIFAVIVGMIYFTIILYFHDNVEAFLKNFFWIYTPSYTIAFYGFSTFFVITIVYFLGNIPCIDRLLVKKATMQEKVYERALRYFVESSVYDTRDRTGILIFISKLEHQVILLADKGISEKIPQEKWNDIVQHIVLGVKSKTIAKNLSESIRECGKLLSEHFPIKEDDTNELDNSLTELSK